MKNETIIKEKKPTNKKRVFHILLIIGCTLISLVAGFLISFFGCGDSYIETSIITAIITLFGFGLTSTVFVYQAFKDKDSEKVKRVMRTLSDTLLLTFILIVVALVLDFIGSLEVAQVAVITINSLKYASLVYAFICQIDILLSFLIIVKNK